MSCKIYMTKKKETLHMKIHAHTFWKHYFFRKSYHGALYCKLNTDTSFITSGIIKLGGPPPKHRNIGIKNKCSDPMRHHICFHVTVLYCHTTNHLHHLETFHENSCIRTSNLNNSIEGFDRHILSFDSFSTLPPNVQCTVEFIRSMNFALQQFF